MAYSQSRKPKKTMGSTGSSVSNVANTGTRQVSTQTTGATGAVRNEVHNITIAGTPGMPGREISVTVPHYDPPTTPMDVHTAGNDALDNAETHLTNARARVEEAIAHVPPEYQTQVRDQVNSAFARGSETIANARKKFK